MGDITVDAAPGTEAGQVYNIPTIRVWYKRKWGTPGVPDAWFRRPNLKADQVVFNAGAQPGVASLHRDYGEVARTHRTTLEFKEWKGIPKVFGWVLIDALVDVNQPPWIIFAGPITRIRQDRSSKHESITAFDMKHVLRKTPIMDAFAENYNHTGAAENIVVVGHSPAFNGGPLGANRSAGRYDVTIKAVEHEIPVFTNASPSRWTSRDIVNYCIAYAHAKTDIRWKLTDDFGEDDDDPLEKVEPVIEVEGRSVVEVIHEAITAAGMGYNVFPWVEQDEVIGGVVRMYTLHSDDLTIGEGPDAFTVKGNPNVVVLPIAAPWIRDTWEVSDDGFDQTIVRGSLIRATRSATNNATEFPMDDVDADLEADWSPVVANEYQASQNKKSERFDSAYCKFRMADEYTPTKTTDPGGGEPLEPNVTGIDPATGELDAEKVNRIKGPTKTQNTSLRYGGIHDNGNAEITHTGRTQIGYLIHRDPQDPKHYEAQPNYRIRDDVLGVEVLGGPLANPKMIARNDRVAITFGVDLDYPVEALVGELAERGFTRIQVVRIPSAKMSIVENAIVHTGKTTAVNVEQASGVLSDWARLRNIALLKHARYAQSIEFVSLTSRRLLFELGVGNVIRVGNSQSPTPIASLTLDLRRGSTAAQSFKNN